MKRVADVMTRDPITIGPDEPIRTALGLMQQGGFRRLPVMESGRLVGIFSDRDLRKCMNIPMVVHEKEYDDYVLDHIQVGSCMSVNPFTLSPDDFLEMAAKLMRDWKVGGCPVMAGDEIVGILTESDLLTYLVDSLEAGTLL